MESWRLIKDGRLSGDHNMAADEALVRALDEGSASSPVVRLYGWAEPTISVGYLQDSSAFISSGLPMVRRITGGRAVLHDAEVTYSVIAANDTPLFSGGILETYSVISRCIIAALKRAGVDADIYRGTQQGLHKNDACFLAPSRYEVLAGGRKLVGSSQRRFKRAFLQHGSILFRIDPEANARVFGRAAVDRMASVSSFSDISEEEFSGILAQEFSAGFGAGLDESGLSPVEERIRREILSSRYSNDEWNLGAGLRTAASSCQRPA